MKISVYKEQDYRIITLILKLHLSVEHIHIGVE